VVPGRSAHPGWPTIAVLCLGVWLHAADSLLAATVMPSAIDEIGGLAFIYWTVGLYQLGSIVAGAATGTLTLRFGLGTAMTFAALIYAGGCTLSAVAPDMATMLLGRLLQGCGGGSMVALAHVGLTQLFPPERWPRLLALISGVWGVSALTGPLIGGAFASAGLWRGAFWAFGLQALALAAVMSRLLGRPLGRTRAPEPVPGGSIAALSGGVIAVLAAGIQSRPVSALLLIALGLGLLAALLALERRRNRLFPPRPLDWRQPWGPGYVMVLMLSLATVSFTVYGPLLMEILLDATPFAAGLMIAAESVSWTVAAVAFAGAGPRLEPALIRGGALIVMIGIAGLAWTMPKGPATALLPWVALLGAGFGMAWAFVMRRVVGSVPRSERERAASSLPTMQLLGYALGAPASGMVANLAGLAADAPRPSIESAAFWLFAAFLPLAGLGVAAAWRLARISG
jgi:MFS transporter